MNPDSNSRSKATQTPGSRSNRATTFIALVLLAVLLVPGMANDYLEYLWFVEDIGQPQAFLVPVAIKSSLFFSGFLLTYLWLNFHLKRSIRQFNVFSAIPDDPTKQVLLRILDSISRGSTLPIKLFAAFAGFIVGKTAAAGWMDWLYFQHGVTVGKKDEAFGIDLGFYLFKLPFIEQVIQIFFAVMLLTAAGYALFTAGLGALGKAAGSRTTSVESVRQLSIIAALTSWALALKVLTLVADSLTLEGPRFTGFGFAESVSNYAAIACSILLVLAGLSLLIKMGQAEPIKRITGWTVAIGAFGILTYGILPGLIRRLYVDPNNVTVESGFAQRGLNATKWAFGLDKIQYKSLKVSETPDPKDLEKSRDTLQKMRLWDPEVYRQVAESLQTQRPYYTFTDADIDRYEIGGTQRPVLLSARQFHARGLNAASDTWISRHLQYTHGYGMILSPFTEADNLGQPNYYLKDLPVRNSAGFELKEPRIYFGDEPEMDYAIAPSKTEEFDYPAEGKGASSHWQGTRGIKLNSFGRKIVAALALGDINLLISNNFIPESRVLYRRNIRERIASIFPYLLLDNDPYSVLLDGRILWVQDAYSVSNRVPYSEQLGKGEDQYNYIRNSVKVVVDAYTGETQAYVMEGEEPLTRTYQAAFPQLFKSAKDMPAGLEKHLRYPEGLFLSQAATLRRYHVDNPRVFLTDSDAWALPLNRGLSGDREPLAPYYVQMRLPDAEKDSFHLILPFTPRERDNMIGWMAASCDPGEYGQLALYNFNRDTLIPGPSQMEAFFNQDRVVAEINRQLNNDQSEIVVGNLVVMPIGSSMLYVEPLFLKSRTSGIAAVPELKKVIAAVKGKVVVADSYQAALELLFGSTAGESTAPIPNPTPAQPAQSPEITQAARQALQNMIEADKALRQGDLGRYSKLNAEAKVLLEKVLQRR